MAYATQQDMADRFGTDELRLYTDRGSPPAGVPDATVLGRYLADATDIVDSYLASRYKLPLNPVPAVIVKITCDLARAAMQATGTPREDVKESAAVALKMLVDLSNGRAALQSAGVEETKASGGGVLMTATGPRVFDHLEDYANAGSRSRGGDWCH